MFEIKSNYSSYRIQFPFAHIHLIILDRVTRWITSPVDLGIRHSIDYFFLPFSGCRVICPIAYSRINAPNDDDAADVFQFTIAANAMENRSRRRILDRIESVLFSYRFFLFGHVFSVKLASRHSNPDRWDLCVVLCMVPATAAAAAAPCSHVFYVCTFGVPLIHDNVWVVFVASARFFSVVLLCIQFLFGWKRK